MSNEAASNVDENNSYQSSGNADNATVGPSLRRELNFINSTFSTLAHALGTPPARPRAIDTSYPQIHPLDAPQANSSAPYLPIQSIHQGVGSYPQEYAPYQPSQPMELAHLGGAEHPYTQMQLSGVFQPIAGSSSQLTQAVAVIPLGRPTSAPGDLRFLGSVWHQYPAPYYMVDRSQHEPPDARNRTGWWKARDRLGWEALLIGIDISHLRSFNEGLYVPRTIGELINPAGNELRRRDRPFASNYFNPNDDDIQYLLKDRSSKARSNDLDKTVKAFPIETRTGPQLPQYNFIIKTRLSSAEEDHNWSIRDSMYGDHPFSARSNDGKLLIFGDKILNSIVMRINYGGRPVSATDIPIGLRWTPKDGRTPSNLFPYAGMMARHVANRIITGNKVDLGPIDQVNYDELVRYAEQHAENIDWMNTRERQYTIAALQLQRAQSR